VLFPIAFIVYLFVVVVVVVVLLCFFFFFEKQPNEGLTFNL